MAVNSIERLIEKCVERKWKLTFSIFPFEEGSLFYIILYEVGVDGRFIYREGELRELPKVVDEVIGLIEVDKNEK